MKKILVFASMFLFFVGTASTSLVSAATTDTQTDPPVVDTISEADPPVITGRAALAKIPMWKNNSTGKVYYLDINYVPPLTSIHYTLGGYTIYVYTTGNGARYSGEDYL